MMDAINIIFRCFDFFVIVGLIVYGVKHYVVPAVEKMLRDHNMFLDNLENDCQNLQAQTQSIYENIQNQDRQFQLLQSKFLAWKEKCAERIGVQKLEQQKTDAAMQNRFLTRSDYIKNDMMIKEQLPAILDVTAKRLQVKYHGTDKQKQYIDTLIHVMKERS